MMIYVISAGDHTIYKKVADKRLCQHISSNILFIFNACIINVLNIARLLPQAC